MGTGYLNISPTKLVRLLKKEKNPQKRAQIKKALDAWRLTMGNPLAKSASRVAQRYLEGNWINPPPPGFLSGSIYKELLYHGSNKKYLSGTRLLPDSQTGEYGIYLTPRSSYARKFGPYLYQVFVNLKNPLFVEGKYEISSGDLTYQDIKRIAQKGYDGIVSGPSISRASEVVLFYPSQAHIFQAIF